MSLKQAILDNMTSGDYRRYYQEHLDGEIGKMNTSGWAVCLCPFHDDNNPSLNVSFFKEGAFKCHACSESGDIFTFTEKRQGVDFKNALEYLANFLNINPADVKKASSKKTKKKKLGDIVGTYTYYDINGAEVCQTVKYDNPKDFRQRRPHPTKPGEYLWNLKGVEVVPYNLPDFKDSNTIYYVEGEKDADRLKQIGLVGTSNPMGAGKFWDSMVPYFKNKKVVVLPDNDDPGHSHAELIAKKLHGYAESIQIVKLPNLPPEGDISDWLSSGNTKADLLEVIKDGEPYESHIDWLNKRHAMIMLGGKCVILNEEYDPVFDRPDVSFSSFQDFKNRYLSKRIPNPNAGQKGQAKTVTIANEWLKSPDKIEYDRIIFSPNGDCPDKCYNLWKGFAFEPVKGDWSLFKDHVYKIISSEKDHIFDWIMAWMARIVQEPGGKRPGTAIVLRGDQGVGKGIFLSNFGKLFGHHHIQISNQAHLTSRFNNHLKSVIFLFVDEGFWAGDKSSEGIVKALVTEDLIMVEPKGKDVVPIESHINLALASNQEWVIPAGLDERRFFVVDVSDIRKKDIPYFKAISDELKGGGYEAMLYDLLRHNRSKVNLYEIPRTAALLDQIIESMSPVHKFWFEKLRSGGWAELVQAEILYNEYVDFCDKIGVRRKKIDKQFGKELKKVCSDLERKYLKTMVDEDENYGYKWHYEFPELEKCRFFFEKVVKIELDWDTDEVFVFNEFSAI